MLFHGKKISRDLGKKTISRKTKGVERIAPRLERVEVIIELPRGLIANPVRKLTIGSPATAGEISKELATKFSVNLDRWKLFGSINKESNPKKLDTSAPIEAYRLDRNPNARLYFYPEIAVK